MNIKNFKLYLYLKYIIYMLYYIIYYLLLIYFKDSINLVNISGTSDDFLVGVGL